MGDSVSADEQVSGFYGPGSWAAWVIMLVSSWITIYLNDYESNTHFIAYTVYTNFAAIDLIRHISRAGFNQISTIPLDGGLMQSTTASGAVLFIGVLQHMYQGIVCSSKLGSASARTRQKVRSRLFIVYFGFILPLSAFLCYLFILLNSSLAFIFLVLFLSTFILTVISKKPRRFNPSLERYELVMEKQKLYFALFMVCPGSWFVYGMIISAYIADHVGSPQWPPSMSSRCFCIPCAPQRIDEWDQLFSLLAALILFCYEFKTGILALSGKLSKFLRNWYTRMVSRLVETSVPRSVSRSNEA